MTKYFEVVVLANTEITRHGICTTSAVRARDIFHEMFHDKQLSQHRVVRVSLVDYARWAELVYGEDV